MLRNLIDCSVFSLAIESGGRVDFIVGRNDAGDLAGYIRTLYYGSEPVCLKQWKQLPVVLPYSSD